MDVASQIAAFVASADELHLGRAATRLGVHPGTVSSRLRALEDRVGLVLIDRSHRCRITVTQAGAALLPAARRALEALSAFDGHGVEVRRGGRGVVRVAVTSEEDAGTESVVRALREVDASWDVSVERMSVHDAGRAMAVGAIECSVGRGRLAPRTAPGGFDPRPNRLEPARVARIAAGAVPAEVGEVRPGLEDPSAGWVIAWRRAWELEDDGGGNVPETPRSSAGHRHAAALVGLVRRLRVAGGDRRALRRASRRRAVEARVRAVAAERRTIAEETERFGAAVAMARARERERAEVRRRVAEARSRGEAISIHLAVAWLCAQDENEDEDVETPGPP